MLSKSALTTLKTILVIDLIIVAIAAPSYLYVNSLVPKPADFEVSNLVIDPDWVEVGEPVEISVKVTNMGDKSGDYMVSLTLNEEPTATETVRLSGNDNTTLVFTVTELPEGDYTVKVEDLTGTLKVSSEAPVRPATLKISDLGISRAEAGIGEPITVSATATNIGDQPGDFTIELYVNDQQEDTRSIQLNSGESQTVEFEVAKDAEGDYVIRLDDLTKSFKVTSNAQPVKPAEFQVTELEVDPTTVVGGESVAVSVKVTNIGEETGGYSVELKVDGASRETKDVTLSGGATKIVTFEVTETAGGSHNVEIGDLSGSFDVENLAPASEDVEISGLAVRPYEVSAGDTITISAKATNLADEPGTLQVRVLINDEIVTTKGFDLEAGAEETPIQLTVTAGEVGGSKVKVVNLGDEENTLSGYFKVVPEGMHTLNVGSYPISGIPFKLDGVEHKTPYNELLPEGDYTLEVEPTYDSGRYIFIGWEDGSTTLSRTISLTERMSITPDFSGGICCPSVYSWNGTGYYYLAEISNGGWLGYIGHIDKDGNVIFTGGNPWDSIKLNEEQLKLKQIENSNYYDITLTQRWDEIFYLDAAYMLVVDYPTDVDVYSTMVRYTNPKFTDEIFTVDKNVLTPISAINENGEDVLFEISKMDGIFAPGINGLSSESWDNPSWNQLTIDLGDLSDADQIKLIINGMVDWGPADIYYDWIDKFEAAVEEGLLLNNTGITPPPYIEVLDANGNWVRVPEDRQIPIPADYVARPFVVDITGIFLTDNYSIRINNFWNVTFDYIGVDTSQQENLRIQRIDPIAELHPTFETPSEAAGDFTRYGNVTELIKKGDDMFVIGMQGDEVSLLFPADDLAPVAEGTKRAFFLFGACWFKDTPTNWGFQYNLTVEPIPFRNMSGFPYTEAESYPYDTEHLAYLDEYNTRTMIDPKTLEPKAASLETWVSAVAIIMAIADLSTLVYYKKRITKEPQNNHI